LFGENKTGPGDTITFAFEGRGERWAGTGSIADFSARRPRHGRRIYGDQDGCGADWAAGCLSIGIYSQGAEQAEDVRIVGHDFGA
jgi:hypothetical protein